MIKMLVVGMLLLITLAAIESTSAHDASDEKIWTMHASDPLVWCSKYLALYNLEKYNESIELRNLSLASLNKDECNDAISASKDAPKMNCEINHSQRCAVCWYNLGKNLFDKGNYSGALLDFNKSLEINPQYGDAWYYKGIALARLGDLNNAAKAIDISKNYSLNEKVISAASVINIIEKNISEKRPIEILNETIIGDLDLSSIELSEKDVPRTPVEKRRFNLPKKAKLFNEPIDIRDSNIIGNVYFGNLILNNSTSFNGTTIYGNADFFGSIFKDNASFVNSAFNNVASFRGAKFYDYADFSDTWFCDYADFSGSKFYSYAYFGDLYNKWGNTTFGREAYFNEVQFSSWAYFTGCQFNNTSFFTAAEFNETDFWKAQFGGLAYFNRSIFDKGVSFSDSNFSGHAYFNYSRFKDGGLFHGANISRLFLNGTRYDTLNIRWSNIKSLDYDESAYYLLIKNFDNLGYYEDADSCYLELKSKKIDDYGFQLDKDKINLLNNIHYLINDSFGNINIIHFLNQIISPIIKCFSDIALFLLNYGAMVFYGFAKNPIAPIGWSISCIIIFGLIWMIGGLKTGDRFDEYSSRSQSLSTAEWIRAGIETLKFSSELFISGNTFIEPPEVPQLRHWSRTWVKPLFTFERILGAFFSILIVLAVGATIIR